jgi:hypothetical protein
MKNIRINRIESRLNGVEPSQTDEGYWLYKNIKIARSGLFDWGVSELEQDGISKIFPDLKKNQVVKLLRPPEAFTVAVLESANLKSITDDHPRDGLVNPANYQRHEKGQIFNILFDGEFLIADLLIKDEKLFRQIKSGKKEVSIGYTYVQPVNFVKGLHYVALEYIVSINHLAFVFKGRAGSECRVNKKFNKRGNQMNEEEILAKLEESARLNSDLLKRLNEAEEKKMKKEKEEEDRMNSEKEKMKKDEEAVYEKKKADLDSRENAVTKKELEFSQKFEELKSRENDVFMSPVDFMAFSEMASYDSILGWFKGQEKSGRDSTSALMKVVADVIKKRENEALAAKEREGVFGEKKDSSVKQIDSRKNENLMFPAGMIAQ